MAGLNNSLQLRISQTQTLSMTPQLQQAIKLLQLSTLELVQEINQTVDLNPLLEIDDKNNDNVESLDAIQEQEIQNDQNFDVFDNDNLANSTVDISLANTNDTNLNFENENINHLLDNTDTSTNNISHNADEFNTTNNQDQHDSLNDNYRSENYIKDVKNGLKNYDLEDSIYEGETTTSLKDHLMFQLDLSPLKGKDYLIAQMIIDGIDNSGYLIENLDDILNSIQLQYSDTTIDDITAVLKLVQHYDPLGVASRSVKECLLIQLQELDQNNSVVKKAIKVVLDYLNLLSNKDFRSLCQKLSVKEDELKLIVDLIKSLNPRPGLSISFSKSDYIIPDVICYKDKDGNYMVELNNQAIPKVKINESYKALMNQTKTKEDKLFFKSHLQEASWFLQSLDKRNDTLLKVAKQIVLHQQDFLKKGEEYMQPLILNDIAKETDLHESTVSRITSQKYIHTPRGTFELKYFFSSKVNTESGGSASSTAIRAHIKNLIAKENKRRPLSDSQLSKELEALGIIAARRTVAKYREAMGIGSSSQRNLLV